MERENEEFGEIFEPKNNTKADLTSNNQVVIPICYRHLKEE